MILTDFQIYISVPLSDEKITYDSELNNNALTLLHCFPRFSTNFINLDTFQKLFTYSKLTIKTLEKNM